MDRYTFLAELHKALKPRGYLEIGVQHGLSLILADCPALGIDPEPKLGDVLSANGRTQAYVVQCESDVFFEFPEGKQWAAGMPEFVDLAFVDGMHLWEYVIRDIRNVERHSNDRTVVVVDDVLPRNQEEASRTPVHGDWTGDCWKVLPILAASRPDLSLTLVDTEPTGVLLVRGADPARVGWDERGVPEGDLVPADVLARVGARDPVSVLAEFAAVTV